MRKIFTVGAMLILAACSAGAQPNQTQPSGQPNQAQASGQRGQRNFEVGAFHGVQLAGIHDVVVTVGGAATVRAEGDTAALEGLEIRVEDGILKVGTRRGWSWRGPDGDLTVYVTAPAIDAASVAGTGDMRIDRVEAQTFTGAVGGTGSLKIAALRATSADFSIAGTGDIEAAGTADRAEISLTGTGDAELGALQLRQAQVQLVGPGGVEIHASESVDGSILGPGDLTVRGGARCAVTKMGPGSINCAG